MPTYTIALAHDTSFYGWWVLKATHGKRLLPL
jgi:hypothetical protein